MTVRVDAALLSAATSLINLGQQVLQKEAQLMRTLQEDIDAITAQTTAIASLTQFIQGLQAQITSIPSLTPEQQTQIDSIFSGVTSNTAAISAAMVANVPPAA